MKLNIRPGTPGDLDALAQLYDDLNDHLQRTVNWPGWAKGIYPARQDAADGLAEGTLWVAEDAAGLAGTVILRHTPQPAYRTVQWQAPLEDARVLVLYTLAVDWLHQDQGVASALLDFAARRGRAEGSGALRLDVYEKNAPAIRLYEANGFARIGAVSLGLEQYGLDRFYLYEKLL